MNNSRLAFGLPSVPPELQIAVPQKLWITVPPELGIAVPPELGIPLEISCSFVYHFSSNLASEQRCCRDIATVDS